MIDLSFSGVHGQAIAVRAGEISALDLTRATLNRIEKLNPRLNAFTEVMRDAALSGALHSADGPLGGVPVGIKQENDVAGSVTTFGGRSNVLPAEADSEVVRRLRAAGAVIVGKTAMPEFGQWPYTESDSAGVTRNPWDSSRTPGGSSGGSAVAVASGMVAAAIGGDGGGSIRIPASCCGIFGLKPSRGRVTTQPNRHLWFSLGTLGPLTRSVLDSAIVYDVIKGSTPEDMFQAPHADSYVEALEKDVGRLRIGWSLKHSARGVRVDKEVAKALEDTAWMLSDLGHEVIPVDVEHSDPTMTLATLVSAGVKDEAAHVQYPDRLEKRTKQHLALMSWVNDERARKAMRAGRKISAEANRVFDKVDVLLTPTLPVLPPRAPALGRAGAPRAALKAVPMIAYTALWNIAGNPAASCPVGWSRGGLPIGMQLVGRMYDEATLFQVAAQLEAATAWTDRRPLL
ncbi:MAG TPA: amidase [Nocardioidaceae bacterium]|nr:amidase [Nocardioidaceae bacterium]